MHRETVNSVDKFPRAADSPVIPVFRKRSFGFSNGLMKPGREREARV